MGVFEGMSCGFATESFENQILHMFQYRLRPPVAWRQRLHSIEPKPWRERERGRDRVSERESEREREREREKEFRHVRGGRMVAQRSTEGQGRFTDDGRASQTTSAPERPP